MFLVSSFFTYLVLSSLLSLNSIQLIRNVKQSLNWAIIYFILILALFTSKTYLAMYTSSSLLTSVELGMGFTLMFLIIMITSGFWPINPQMFHSVSFPSE